jgi:hypothetical protein
MSNNQGYPQQQQYHQPQQQYQQPYQQRRGRDDDIDFVR